MEIFFNKSNYSNRSLINVLFDKNQKKQKNSKNKSIDCKSAIDALMISPETMEKMAKEKLTKISGTTGTRSHNRVIDKSIDLEYYIDLARKHNQKLIDNAGTEIEDYSKEYMDIYKTIMNALKEKYSKLLVEAKKHPNPEAYIHSKYCVKSSKYYESGLTADERLIAYSNEQRMYETGEINSSSYTDSLFSGNVSPSVSDMDDIMFRRGLVNAQISNILKQVGVDSSLITDDCIFSVNPYSYEITVDGVDEDTKALMESALNVGRNGKSLYLYIYHCACESGCESSQVTDISTKKYRVYQEVYDYTGYELDKLEEKNGTYYTEQGEDILDLVDSAINSTEYEIPEFRQVDKDWIRKQVTMLSINGWDSVPDMTLSIMYGKNGLKDMYQNVIYDYDAYIANRAWNSVV